MKYRAFLFTICLLAIGVACNCGRTDPNIPASKDFDRILKNDLAAYVTDKNDKDISITYEMLRNGPSQSGVALPKFYIWIEKHSADGKLMEDAAARIAAVEGTHFEVIQYFKREQIVKDPGLVKGVFPDEVVQKIYAKVGIDGK